MGYYEDKEREANEHADKLERKYLNKKVETEHGDGYVCGFDLPKSRAWRLKIKIVNNTKKPILKSMFPEQILCYNLSEVQFL